MTKQLIIAADIFGCTPELVSAVEAVSGEAILVSPYIQGEQTFTSEPEAYRYFTHHSSIEAYAEKLTQVISQVSSPALVVGFSVGAAAAWLVSSQLECNRKLQFDLFYGGQIRHFLDARPKHRVCAFLPLMESHFDINIINKALQQKGNVNLYSTLFMHGFMNPLSGNYSLEGAQQYWLTIKSHWLGL